MSNHPRPFEVHESGAFLHGRKAALAVGVLLVPEHASNFEECRISNHIYVTKTLDAAAWGAEFAMGEGRGRVYAVEPTGEVEDDPNVTDKRFPGNPARSYRTKDPVRVVGELPEWTAHPPEQLRAMKGGLPELRRRGEAILLN